jgi:hypothetical protein
MTAIIKTWPAFFTPERTLAVFTHPWAKFYFTLGRGRPKIAPDEIWFTHRGAILGHFRIGEIVRNEGQLPKLARITGEESEWQIRPDNWVAICPPPFETLGERLFFAGFRGWRYFDLAKHRSSLDARIRL